MREQDGIDLARFQAKAARALGRASGVRRLIDSSPTVPPVPCPNCRRDVSMDPWSYHDPPRRWCSSCYHTWADAEGLATARAEGQAIHFSTPETMALKDRGRGRTPKRSLARERRERAMRERTRAKAKAKRKAQRKARRR